MEKLLTIAIPTYNRACFLARLLDLIEAEVTDEIEVLVSDNDSSDNTEEMIKKYPFVQYYRNTTNIGADANFLECYKKASGKYVWLVGSDDIVVSGAIKHIVHFINLNKSEKMPIIFLNHNSFSGEYNSATEFGRNYLNCLEDLVIENKNEFIKCAGKQLTFMSSFILEQSYFNKVNRPEQYYGTHFIHTCIAFNATHGNDLKYGVIGQLCLSQDLTPTNTSMNQNYARCFEIFGKSMYHVLVDVASQFGYDKRIMRKIFHVSMRTSFIWWIIKAKELKQTNATRAFWEYCYPFIKGDPLSVMTMVPIAIAPAFVSKIYLKLSHRK